MNDYAMTAMPVESIKTPLPPREARNLAQNALGANEEWRNVIDAARNFDGKNVANGTRLFLNLSRFFHELIGEGELCGRLVQHIEQKLRNDFPPQQGRLF